jgi:predicted dehydrogenase
VDTDPFKLENASTWGVEEEAGYANIADMMKFHDERIDLIIIATPIYTHHVLVAEAVEHGLNVICEKNMAQSVTNAAQMVELAQANPELVTAVGTQYRYFHRNWTVKKFLSDPECPIGTVADIKYVTGGFWPMRQEWRGWLQDIYCEDMAPHHFDLFRYWTGMDAVKVKADVYKPSWSKWLGTSGVNAAIQMAKPGEYERSNNYTHVFYSGSWQVRHQRPEFIEIEGTKGYAELTKWGVGFATFDDQWKASEMDVFPVDVQVGGEWNEDEYCDQAYILHEVSRGIQSKGKQQPSTCFPEAFKSFCISMACIQSARSEQTVWVPDLWKGLLD